MLGTGTYRFQSPLGEVVKETLLVSWLLVLLRSMVSIPSRGSGKGDNLTPHSVEVYDESFQSPLGEVVKETSQMNTAETKYMNVSIPSRGSGKGDFVAFVWRCFLPPLVSIPSRGSGKGDLEYQ